jgi:DNA repair photolyase
MKITTETGSCYVIERGICKKLDSAGRTVDVFKVYMTKAVSDEVNSIEEIYELERSEPEVGKRLYISGKEAWWISTKVVRIEY